MGFFSLVLTGMASFGGVHEESLAVRGRFCDTLLVGFFFCSISVFGNLLQWVNFIPSPLLVIDEIVTSSRHWIRGLEDIP